MRWLLILLVLLGGCGSEGGPGPDVDGGGGMDAYDAGIDEETPECVAQADCGKYDEVLCVNGACQDQEEGYGQILLGVGFPRGSEYCAKRIMIYVYLEKCEEEPINRMAPEYNISLDWSGGGTFFPNILLQFIRSADVSVAVYAIDQDEIVIGEGCKSAIVTADERTELNLSITLY